MSALMPAFSSSLVRIFIVRSMYFSRTARREASSSASSR